MINMHKLHWNVPFMISLVHKMRWYYNTVVQCCQPLMLLIPGKCYSCKIPSSQFSAWQN